MHQGNSLVGMTWDDMGRATTNSSTVVPQPEKRKVQWQRPMGGQELRNRGRLQLVRFFFGGRSICPLEYFEKGLLYPTQFLVGLRYLHNHLWVKDEPERWLQALLCGPGRPIVPVRIGLAHQYCDTTLPPAIPSQIYHRFIQIPIFCDQTFATDTVEEILR